MIMIIFNSFVIATNAIITAVNISTSYCHLEACKNKQHC